jgi:hypothetical protein
MMAIDIVVRLCQIFRLIGGTCAQISSTRCDKAGELCVYRLLAVNWIMGTEKDRLWSVRY